jgi:AcrR family transcriptional regulator
MELNAASGPADSSAVEIGNRRPQRQPLTRQRIVRAALRIMDEEGLEAVTMRRIGRALGVEAMSLYNHVRDKEEILDAICEEVLTEFRFPVDTEWADTVRAAAREYRRLLLAHPRVITLMTGRKSPFTNVESLKVYEFALALFRRGGLSVEDAVKAFNSFGSYILGSVTMELGMMINGKPDDAHVRAHADMARLVGSADLPYLRESLPHMIECDIEEQFEFGLDLLVDAVSARIPAGAEDPTGR